MDGENPCTGYKEISLDMKYRFSASLIHKFCPNTNLFYLLKDTYAVQNTGPINRLTVISDTILTMMIENFYHDIAHNQISDEKIKKGEEIIDTIAHFSYQAKMEQGRFSIPTQAAKAIGLQSKERIRIVLLYPFAHIYKKEDFDSLKQDYDTTRNQQKFN